MGSAGCSDTALPRCEGRDAERPPGFLLASSLSPSLLRPRLLALVLCVVPSAPLFPEVLHVCLSLSLSLSRSRSRHVASLFLFSPSLALRPLPFFFLAGSLSISISHSLAFLGSFLLSVSLSLSLSVSLSVSLSLSRSLSPSLTWQCAGLSAAADSMAGCIFVSE